MKFDICLAMDALMYEKRLRSRSALSKRAGLDESTINRIWRGEAKPSLDTLQALARVAEMKLSDFIATGESDEREV